ncbi:hypothetical protein BTJ68_01310 [Hortaea werneckii EXF-2000]|uniref:Prenylcysteine lyase domain-containing protein n=1 Tax=Hortaea werneckii EXF-2000 TaxID=1157616 RepID=A0A1Z5TRB1_HORWE|nr:hypothetical protein BTJ68_01310 [Hortaea werneckii EXF-2000]
MRLLSALLAITARAALNVVTGEGQVPLTPNTDHCDTPLNVAIIGAGAAGSSSAYHLAHFAREAGLPINITLFDRNPYIGGRSTTVNVHDDPAEPVELGASIFVQANQILINATRDFNLSTTDNDDDEESSIPGPALAIWDGRSLLYQQTTGKSWWETAKLIWKYGLLSPLRTLNLKKSTIASFLTLYDSPIFPFDSLTHAAEQVGLRAVTNVSGETYLRTHGIRGGLWPRGGTVRDAGELRAESPLDPRVGGDAAPYQSLNLTLTPSSQLTHTPSPIPYVSLHVTLFTTSHLLSPTFFNLSPDTPAPKTILTTLPPDEAPGQGSASAGSVGFFSISLIRSLRNLRTGEREYLYKIFSPERVRPGFLARILGVRQNPSGGEGEEEGEGAGFDRDEKENDDDDSDRNPEQITWLYQKRWDSYPYETPRDAFEAIRLSRGSAGEGGQPGGGGIWYTGGMESFISTMETNALMGMNVARLVVDEWVAGLGRDGG